MPIPESLKTKYSLSGERYIAENADRAISDLVACISRMHSENTELVAKLKTAERHVDELASKVRSLEDENANLDLSVHELTSTNRRLTAEAERLDKKLADVSVAVTANDKKLSDAADRLATLTERAEQLCAHLAERSNEICRNFDMRIALLSTPICIDNNSNDHYDAADEIATTDNIEENSDEYAELEQLTDSDELSIDDDPNLFDEAIRDKEDIIDEPDISPDAEHDTDEMNHSNSLDDLNESASAVTKPRDEERTYNTEPIPAPSETAGTPTHSPTDDDIKSMLAAMYADTASESSASAPQRSETLQASHDTHDGDNSKNSDFGSVKSTLDAIRRKIGNKNGENGK